MPTNRNAAILQQIQDLTTIYNPCNIKDGRCRDGTPCCVGCKHLMTIGCSVNSPACQMFFCTKAWKQFPLIVQTRIKELCNMYTGPLRWRFDGELIPRGHMKPPFVWS